MNIPQQPQGGYTSPHLPESAKCGGRGGMRPAFPRVQNSSCCGSGGGEGRLTPLRWGGYTPPMQWMQRLCGTKWAQQAKVPMRRWGIY